MTLLEVNRIHKRFDTHWVLNDVTLSLEKGNILCLLGPSGCGKTTLLRVIAGLEKADSGRILFGGENVEHIPVHQRRFRMMFQEFALFPHKNVFDNIAFGLQVQNLPPADIKKRTLEMLSLVGLEGFDARDVNVLSGGERQRVALARSLAPDPLLLMLDEPLGFLDRSLRKRLLMDLNRILREVKIATIFVTHDQAEAFALADQVVVMKNGRVLQVGPPETLYRRPANPDVAKFLGFQNLIPGDVAANGSIRTPIGEIKTAVNPGAIGRKAMILLRPEGARLIDQSTASGKNETKIKGLVIDRLFQGHFYHVRMHTDSGYVLEWDLPGEVPPPKIDQPIFLLITSASIVLFPH